TSIHLIQEGITELIQILPDRRFLESDRAEYNRRMALNFERVRDFLVLHYIATERTDTELWRYMRALALPESLEEKMAAWLTRGHLIRYEFGVFLPPSWVAVMLGQNLWPRGYDPRVDRLPEHELVAQAEAIRTGVQRAVAAAPDHAAYIKQSGAASMTAPHVAKAG
ncbi:MAG: tryptophan 7-halogenase, partial [Asticcacaulis sp.]